MLDITLSASTRSALLALSMMQDKINQLQGELATGKRVNDPTDNPTAYFLAAGLSNRANAINGLMDGITNAQSAISAATKGITAIQALLTSAQNIANQALQNPQSLVSVIGTNSTAFTTASVIATSGGASNRFKAGDTVTVNDGTTTATYTAANNDTIQTFLNAINGTAGLKVTASLSSSGQLQFAATSNVNVTIGGTTTGSGTLTGVLSLTAGTTNYQANTTRQGLAIQFDSLRTQIDQAAADAGFNGVNFLTGSSSVVTFNETGTSKLSITGGQATSGGLGVVASTNSFQLDGDINAALSNITKAMTSLQTMSTSIGAMSDVLDARATFNKALMDTLNSGADALTAADTNADSAALLALKTRQEIAATAISLTKAGDSSALRLLA